MAEAGDEAMTGTGLSTQPLFTLNLRVAPPQAVGPGPLGNRFIVPILSGSFVGPQLRGVVEPNGADWVLVRPDRAMQLDVRLVLRTEQDVRIGMTYRGFRHGPAEVMSRLSRGEEADPASYYFRMAAFFECADERLDWLNRIVAVGTGRRSTEGPIYQVFEVL
ncbi:MAG TPA: DUF3237 domain-containing protein [Acetobacteraceae bacterium]|nr:DUF3237 domain-containing protein [Acetobacteraceae bacterium]